MEVKRVNSISQSVKSYPFLNKSSHAKCLTELQYRLVIKLFLKKLVNKIITTGLLIELPTFIGAFRVMSWKRKHKRKLVNFKKTNLLRRETGNDNIVDYNINYNATEGYQPVLRWYKRARNAAFVTNTNITGFRFYASFANWNNYSVKFTRTVIRKNLNHTIHADINLTDYFNNTGYFEYEKLN